MRPEGTGYYLADGELTAPAIARPVDLSVTAGLFGGDDLDVVLASWSSTGTSCLRSQDGRMTLAMQMQPVMLNSLPSSVRIRVRAAAPPLDADGAWRLVLHFRDRAGSGLTWQSDLPPEAFGGGWLAPLADLLTIDGAVVEPAPAPRPTVTVVHHPEDEYYELLVDGHQAGLLVYHVIGSHLSITHTVVEPTYRGQGLSWVLVGRALDDIRTRDVTVSNYCAVVRRFVEKHPEYDDILSRPRTA